MMRTSFIKDECNGLLKYFVMRSGMGNDLIEDSGGSNIIPRGLTGHVCSY